MGSDPISGYSPKASGTGGVWGMGRDLGNRQRLESVCETIRNRLVNL